MIIALGTIAPVTSSCYSAIIVIIDSFVHVRPFSAEDSGLTPLPPLNRAIDRLLGHLNDPVIDRVYNASMNALNLRDNQLMPKPGAPGTKLLQRIALTANLPFSAGKDDKELLRSMNENGIDRAFVSALEPFSSSAHVLEVCRGSSRLLPLIGFHPDGRGLADRAVAPGIAETLDGYLKDGARGVHLHPVLENTPPENPRYFEIAEAARARGIPLICRTGVTAYAGHFDETLAEIRNYDGLVRAFPTVTFIMTHSNLADYRVAIDFAKRYENCYLDTAWQTTTSIREMIAALGSERILLASGWPVLGDQQRVQVRILKKLGLPEDDLENVRWRNATRIYRLES